MKDDILRDALLGHHVWHNLRPMLSHFTTRPAIVKPTFSRLGRVCARLSFGAAMLASAPAWGQTESDSLGANGVEHEMAATGADLPQSMRDAADQLDRLEAAAQAGTDLRTRALLAWRNPVVSFPEGTANLATLTKLGVPDDPATLMLFATGCDAFEVGCDALPFASRWTEVDADNAAAWLNLWNVDTRLGDNAAGDAALARAVAATSWRDYTLELTSAFVAIADPSPDVLVRLVARLQSAPRIVGVVSVSYRDALSLCRLPSKREQCNLLIDRIAAMPVSLLQATVAASLSLHFGTSQQVATARREQVEAWQWAVAQGQPHGLLSSDPRANAREVIAYIDGLNQQGEVSAARRVLAAKHMSDSQAALLFRSSRAQPQHPSGSIQDQSGARLKMPSQ